eukprot:XP_001700718.1 predicted protein [Chlamydomonas reinhardtii]
MPADPGLIAARSSGSRQPSSPPAAVQPVWALIVHRCPGQPAQLWSPATAAVAPAGVTALPSAATSKSAPGPPARCSASALPPSYGVHCRGGAGRCHRPAQYCDLQVRAGPACALQCFGTPAQPWRPGLLTGSSAHPLSGGSWQLSPCCPCFTHKKQVWALIVHRCPGQPAQLWSPATAAVAPAGVTALPSAATSKSAPGPPARCSASALPPSYGVHCRGGAGRCHRPAQYCDLQVRAGPACALQCFGTPAQPWRPGLLTASSAHCCDLQVRAGPACALLCFGTPAQLWSPLPRWRRQVSPPCPVLRPPSPRRARLRAAVLRHPRPAMASAAAVAPAAVTALPSAAATSKSAPGPPARCSASAPPPSYGVHCRGGAGRCHRPAQCCDLQVRAGPACALQCFGTPAQLWSPLPRWRRQLSPPCPDAQGWQVAGPECEIHGTGETGGSVRYVNQIIYECEAEHYPFGIEEALEEMCTAVWEAAVQIAPYLTKYRDEFLSAWGRQAMYGDTATNLVSMTKNCAVSLHLDPTDGPYSIMLWRHNGAGSLDGGHFLMPGASIKVLPTDMTIVVLAAGMVTHGTAPVLESTGEARRYGYSHFLRVPAMERVARLIKASGGKKKMEELQVQGMKRVLAARTAADRKARRDEIQKQRDELLKSALDGEALPEGEHLAFAVRGLKWHRDIVKCLVWQDFKGKS